MQPCDIPLKMATIRLGKGLSWNPPIPRALQPIPSGSQQQFLEPTHSTSILEEKLDLLIFKK